MKKITKERVKNFIVDLFFLIVACSIGAFSTIGILIPNGLSSGSITGTVRILQNFVPLDFSTMYYIGVLTILIICLITLGVKEAKKILLMTIIYPAILMLFERLNFQLLEQKDIILAAIYCGVFSGICTGIVFSRGYSFGASDTLAKIIQKKLLPQLSLSKILMTIDACVIIASGFVFGRNIALYALITTVIISKTIDFVLFGLETKIIKVEIITEHSKQIVDYIIEDVERGVSIEKITGAYTKKERDKILVLCSPREGVLIRQKVAKLDSEALITIMHVNAVWGNGIGFNDIDTE